MSGGEAIGWAVGLAGSVGALGWVAHLAHYARYHRRVIFLTEVDPPAPAEPPSTVALVVAARDEAGQVEAAVASMLREARSDPSTHVVVVDDRSTDGTGEILDALAAAEPRLQVLHVTELPDGWLGKTHALQVGSESPAAWAADWLLFTDADVVFAPGAVRRAVNYAASEGLGHLAVVPEVIARGVGERAFVGLFGLLFSMKVPLGQVADPRRRTSVGIGAFNLVRADAFRGVGGFRHLSLSLDDDMRLGQTLKFAGYSTRLVFGRGLVAVRWQEGVGGLVRGVEKNFFAALLFRVRRVALVSLGLVTLGIAPFVALVVGPWATRVVAGVGLLALLLTMAASGRQSRIGAWYVATVPWASVLILVALIRSAALTLRRRGVVWRDSFYPLAALRTHVRYRDAWLREVWRSTR